MRIVLFTETYLPYINGVVTHVKALKDGLEKLGHEVLVVTADPNVKAHILEDNILHCPAKKMSKKMYGYGLANPFSKKRLKYIRDFNPDVGHIHQEFTIGLWASRSMKKLGIPTVSTIHTMYDDYIYYVAPKPFIPLVRWISHKYFKYIVKNSKEITGPSSKSQVFMDECHVNKTVHVFPNPVELDIFKPGTVSKVEADSLREHLGISKDDTVACFIGRLGKEKSVDVLLNFVAKEIKSDEHIHLLICGSGPAYNDLILQSKKLGIDKMCSFPGLVQHSELNPYLAISKCYVTASLSDTNSISMKEAMAAGLPVLHITDKMNRGQIVDGVNGYVYTDSGELAHHLRMIRDMDKEQYNLLSRNVLQHVQQFSDVALAKNLLGVYEQAINDR